MEEGIQVAQQAMDGVAEDRDGDRAYGSEHGETAHHTRDQEAPGTSASGTQNGQDRHQNLVNPFRTTDDFAYLVQRRHCRDGLVPEPEIAHDRDEQDRDDSNEAESRAQIEWLREAMTSTARRSIT